MDFDEREQVRFMLRSGDLLVCEGGEPGRSAVWESQIEPCCYQKALHRIRPMGDVTDSHYLMYYLWFAAMSGHFTDSNAKTTIAHLPLVRLARFQIGLPPLPEQRRIAARLREQLAEVAQARTALQCQLAAAEKLQAAALREAFSSSLHSGQITKMDRLVTITAAQVDPTKEAYRTLPHVSAQNIEAGTGRLLPVRSAADDGMTSGKYLFDEGDVLYSKLRPYLRKVTMAPFTGLCSADMYPLKVNESLLDSRFAIVLLLSEAFTEYAVGASQRSRMPKLNRKQLFSWEVRLPTLDQQHRIVAELDALQAPTQALIASIRTRLEAVEKLPAALLREAFNGGPTGGESR